MSIRTFIIRSMTGRKESICVQPHETFDEVKHRIMEVFDIDPSKQLKLMYSSKIVNSDTFNMLHDGVVIGFVTTKAGTTAAPIMAPVTAPVAATTPVTDAEPMYKFANIKAFSIVFLNFIATNPQLRNAFLNNFGLLTTELINNKDLDELMRNILSQSDSILRSMEKGENIKLNMNMSNKKMEKMDGVQNGVESIELTDQDSSNIDQIIAMGFHPDKVVVEYLKAGKNISRTLDALQK